MLYSCSYKSSSEEIFAHQNEFKTDKFPYKGTYHWNFNLMGSTQHSSHQFFPDSIQYKMKGKVYSAEYTMRKLSYDQSDNKWIGVDEKGNVYTLFFKDQTDSTITIYKRKCKSNGIQEALTFSLPEPDVTDDHGWNVYAFEVQDQEDLLDFEYYVNSDSLNAFISDSLILYNQLEYAKMSYHHGEKRWVGKRNNSYLQVFVGEQITKDSIQMSIEKWDNLELMYKEKFNQAKFKTYVISK